MTSLAYLATPYTHYPRGITAVFKHAARLAAQLLRAGIYCYSPIVQTHPMAVHGSLTKTDLEFWLAYDKLMMQRSDVLIVAHMLGWEESKGIAYEVKFFEATGKPIFDLEPKTLKMVKR